jgi:hypothetical protein
MERIVDSEAASETVSGYVIVNVVQFADALQPVLRLINCVSNEALGVRKPRQRKQLQRSGRKAAGRNLIVRKWPTSERIVDHWGLEKSRHSMRP